MHIITCWMMILVYLMNVGCAVCQWNYSQRFIIKSHALQWCDNKPMDKGQVSKKKHAGTLKCSRHLFSFRNGNKSVSSEHPPNAGVHMITRISKQTSGHGFGQVHDLYAMPGVTAVTLPCVPL